VHFSNTAGLSQLHVSVQGSNIVLQDTKPTKNQFPTADNSFNLRRWLDIFCIPANTDEYVGPSVVAFGNIYMGADLHNKTSVTWIKDMKTCDDIFYATDATCWVTAKKSKFGRAYFAHQQASADLFVLITNSWFLPTTTPP
jgi:hypothetical protein